MLGWNSSDIPLGQLILMGPGFKAKGLKAHAIKTLIGNYQMTNKKNPLPYYAKHSMSCV